MEAISERRAPRTASRRRDAALAKMNEAWRAAERSGDPTRHGPQDRMRILYQIHADALIRGFLHWTQGDRHAAEDLMQETMLRAWRNLDTLHADPVSLRPWLITVSRRLAIDALRARAARPPETPDDGVDLPAVADPYERILDRSMLRDMLTELRPEHRQVLIHVYVHDLTVPQTARLLEIPEGTVKSRLYSARQAIREAFALGIAESAA
jgi:RNA polymerase sigma-70 factor (ECF subfamily)